MIDVHEAETSRTSLRLWPERSDSIFNEAQEQWGENKLWYQTKFEKTVFDLKKAAIEVEGLHTEKRLTCLLKRLSLRHQQFKPYFITKENKEFRAFYVYITSVK